MESNGAKTSDIDLSVFISSGGMDEKKKSQVIGNLSCGRYMDDATKACRKAFVFGCVEPDYNYASYLKGWGTGKPGKRTQL